jgi:hypothetical protein
VFVLRRIDASAPLARRSGGGRGPVSVCNVDDGWGEGRGRCADMVVEGKKSATQTLLGANSLAVSCPKCVVAAVIVRLRSCRQRYDSDCRCFLLSLFHLLLLILRVIIVESAFFFYAINCPPPFQAWEETHYFKLPAGANRQCNMQNANTLFVQECDEIGEAKLLRILVFNM